MVDFSEFSWKISMRQNCQKRCYKGIPNKSSRLHCPVVASYTDWLVSYNLLLIILFQNTHFCVYISAANLWNILTLNSNVPSQTNQSPLSSLSISVLLILINHCTSPPPPKGNPYRTCISSLSGNN